MRRSGALLIGAIALVGLAVSMTAPTPAAEEPEVKQLALGFGIDIGYSPAIIAIQKGWFKEAGFSGVTIKTFPAAVLAGEALAAGQIQLWIPGGLPAISMYHNGIPIVVLGVNAVSWEAEKLVVRKDANVNTPEDLYRVKIGLLQGSSASALLHNLARHYKLDEKRLQVVNLPPPEQLAALLSGNIQAMLVWEPWVHRAVGSGNAKVVHTGLVSRFAGNDGERVRISNTRTVFIAAQPFVRKNPKTARAMMEVLLRAQRYAADQRNKEDVIRTFSESMKQDPEINRAIWDVHVFNPAMDQAHVDDMERTADFLEAAGRIKKRTHVLEWTYTGLVEELDASLVTVKGRWKP